MVARGVELFKKGLKQRRLNLEQLKLQTVGTVLMIPSASPPFLTLAAMSGVFMNAYQKKTLTLTSENLLFSVFLLHYKERVDPKSTLNLGG